MRVDAIITATNHAETIAQVARVAACSPNVNNTIVVDGGSTDDTSERASSVQGTRVIRVGPGHTRGEYGLVGMEAASNADVLVFLDPDLVGLTQAHLESLIWAVSEGNCGMSCGLFDRGPFVNQVFTRMLPIVDSQRAVCRSVTDALSTVDIATFSLEAALNLVCAGLRVPTHSFVLRGLRYRIDPERGRPPLGLIREHVALGKSMLTYASYMLVHRPPVPATGPSEQTATAAA